LKRDINKEEICAEDMCVQFIDKPKERKGKLKENLSKSFEIFNKNK